MASAVKQVHIDRVTAVWQSMDDLASSHGVDVEQTQNERTYTYKIINLVAEWVQMQVEVAGPVAAQLEGHAVAPEELSREILSESELQTALAVTMWMLRHGHVES